MPGLLPPSLITMRLSVLFFLALLPAFSQQSDTHHEVTIAGQKLRYTARAGLIPIRDNDTGDTHANMFYVAYTLDRPAGSSPRPLTFLWNGGPGSNSGLVHLLGFGPKRIAMAQSGTALIDNQDTWLAFSDLVFVDPVGTGYSRPTKPEYAGEFYQGRGDAESVAEFIRVYRLRADAYDAPLYIMGESYGVTRCALVAEALERRRTHLTGVVMLSGGFPLVDLTPVQRNSLALPTLTAAAWRHKKLPADLQAQPLPAVLRLSESYARGDYASALAQGENLPVAQRDAVVAQLARFTGIPVQQIDRAKLVVPMEQFSTALLVDRKLVVGRYDSRIVGPPDPSPQYDPTTDPSLKDILDSVSVLRYLRNELGYQSDLNYQGPFGGAYPPATAFRGDWMSVRWNRSGPQPSPTAAFQSAMTMNPSLRVMVVSGIFDLVSSYFAIEQAAAQLPPDLARRTTIRTYAGGHAIYTDDEVRHQFRLDAGKFVVGQVADVADLPRAQSPKSHQLAYTARAGLIPILNNDAGEPHAHMFYVAYTLDHPTTRRPVTFLWNGGPGANSSLVHLSGFGPRRIRSADDPATQPALSPQIEDNDATWLEFTDLVFVDPVGTGFSRPTKAEYAKEFHSTLGDIASIAEFIRVYRTRFDLYDAALFLAGESYGTWRASGVAEALERRGQHVAGVILISGGIQMGPVSPDAVRVALFVPSRTAAAFYHHKLAPELMRDEQATLKEAETWALNEYAPAWEHRDQLSETERDRILAQLARFTGVPESAIDRKSLAMTSPQFTAALLKDQDRRLGRYDVRLTSPTPAADDAVILRYLRKELKFETDLAYQGIEEGWSPAPAGRGSSIGSRWVWDQFDSKQPPSISNPGSGDGPPPAQPWLRRAMTINPALKIFLVAGLYDSLNSCADNRYLAAHIQPPDFGRNITVGCYRAGHMMYDTKEARYALKRDAAQFIRNATR